MNGLVEKSLVLVLRDACISGQDCLRKKWCQFVTSSHIWVPGDLSKLDTRRVEQFFGFALPSSICAKKSEPNFSPGACLERIRSILTRLLLRTILPIVQPVGKLHTLAVDSLQHVTTSVPATDTVEIPQIQHVDIHDRNCGVPSVGVRVQAKS